MDDVMAQGCTRMSHRRISPAGRGYAVMLGAAFHRDRRERCDATGVPVVSRTLQPLRDERQILRW
jgi:hypothetical protein